MSLSTFLPVVGLETDLSCPLVDAGEIYLGDELHGRRRVRVVLSAVDIQAIDAILVGALHGSNLSAKYVRS